MPVCYYFFNKKKLMSIQKTLFCAFLCLVGMAALFSSAKAQSLVRVDKYIATPFQATWNDIAMTGDTFRYNKGDMGWATITMPFDFPYDDSLIPAGSIIHVGASGAISLSSDTTPNGPALDSAGHPGFVCIFSAFLVAGTGNAKADSDYVELDGVEPNRVLTVEYHFEHVPGTGSGGGGGGTGGSSAMMQVKFYETTGVIEFIYQKHNSAFEAKPIALGAIGLNGFSAQGFLANIYADSLTATPATDIRWTPSTSAVHQQVANAGFTLGNCYPNPLSASTGCQITLPVAAEVHLSILDLQGEVVETVLNQHFGAGTFAVEMNADALPSGTYYYQMTAGDVTLTRQMVVVK